MVHLFAFRGTVFLVVSYRPYSLPIFQLLPFFTESAYGFHYNIVHKSRMQEILEKIPVFIITNPDVSVVWFYSSVPRMPRLHSLDVWML